MKPKINIDKLVCNLFESGAFEEGSKERAYINNALKSQGLKYDGGEIISENKHMFNQGDWITNGGVNLQISNFLKYNAFPCYIVDSIDGTVPYQQNYIEKNFRLWSIMDAKDGDFLTATLSGKKFIFIFKSVWEKPYIVGKHISVYAYYSEMNEELVGGTNNFASIDSSYVYSPSTRSEKNLFFEKLEKNGLKWNSTIKRIEATYSQAVDQSKNELFEKSWKFLESCIEDCMARFLETWSDDAKKETKRKFIEYLNKA